ncbi:MAG: VOC family protein [Oscillospiraceae bacterium]|nr:VOC family protein [Oscillospiraceae bacterium]
MKTSIEHVAVYVKDLEHSKEFYQKYFNAESNKKYQNKSGFSSYFLTFSSGARIEIMSHTELIYKDVIDKVSGLNHIAFSVGSREEVTRLTESIVSDGYTLLSPLRETGDGYFESCIADPDGNRLEITE